MKKVAKLLIENDNKYLMMYRSSHPTFGKDPDLPGGTAEDDESGLTTVLREVEEEIGFHINKDETKLIYEGSEYSKNGTYYYLFFARLSKKPKIVMSWEHSSYEWISKEDFINKSKQAIDTYMHMAGNTLSSLSDPTDS